MEDIACVSVLLQILQHSTKELESSLKLGGSWPLAIVCRVRHRIHKEFTQKDAARAGREGVNVCEYLCTSKNAHDKASTKTQRRPPCPIWQGHECLFAS